MKRWLEMIAMLTAAAALALLAVSLWVGSRTGREFLPQLEEGTIVRYDLFPVISIGDAPPLNPAQQKAGCSS